MRIVYWVQVLVISGLRRVNHGGAWQSLVVIILLVLTSVAYTDSQQARWCTLHTLSAAANWIALLDVAGM